MNKTVILFEKKQHIPHRFAKWANQNEGWNICTAIEMTFDGILGRADIFLCNRSPFDFDISVTLSFLLPAETVALSLLEASDLKSLLSLDFVICCLPLTFKIIL